MGIRYPAIAGTLRSQPDCAAGDAARMIMLLA
jgi:hypothetical protein